MSELAKISPSAVLANDTLTPHQFEQTITYAGFKSSLMTKKNFVILLASILLGLVILFCIAVFDQIVDIPEEISFLRLDRIGECEDIATASANVISERINLIAKNRSYNKLPIISTIPVKCKYTKDLHQVLETICTSASDDSLSIPNFNYPDGYMANLSDINGSDGLNNSGVNSIYKRKNCKTMRPLITGQSSKII